MKMLPDAFKMLIPDDVNGIGLMSESEVQEEQAHALQCLSAFLKDFQKHQNSINVVRHQKNATKADICAVLAVHLFSNLIPGKEVVLDKRMKGLGKECPCKCRSLVPSGNTGIGHKDVWHGNIDILVQHTAIAIESLDTDEENQESDYNSDDQEIVDKKGKLIEKNPGIYRYDFGLWLIAQTITNGFAQGARSNFPNQLMPTIGGTVDELLVYLYDPDQDILLRRTKKLSLFDENNRLFLPTVVELWFVLNLHYFNSSLSRKRCKMKGY